MTTSTVDVSAGTGTHVATYDIAEDAITKKVQRVVLNKSDGTESTFNNNGQAVPGSSAPVVNAACGYSAAVALTRTADTNLYAAGDVIGAAPGSTAALTFTGMGPTGQDVMVTSISLEIDASALISGETSYLLELYNVTPPSALGDNASWDLPSGDRTSHIGTLNLGTPIDKGSTLKVETDVVNKQIKLSGSNVFGYLVTVGTYTPTSGRVYVVNLHTVAL